MADEWTFEQEAVMDSSPRGNVFALDRGITNSFTKTMLKVVGRPLARALALEQIGKLYESIPHEAAGREFLQGVIRAFGFRCRVSPEELARIPASGPVIVVANHPFGGMEGILLADMLLAVRPDMKIMANHVLERIPEFAHHFIFVDPFGGKKSLTRNIGPMKDSLRWLKQGSLLGVFPAGEVAHFTLRERRVAEPVWSPTIARMVRSTGATVVPVHFAGANGLMFHLAGMVHPRLRTALLPREFLNKGRDTVQARVGSPIPAARLEGMGDQEAADFLRMRTEVLGGGTKGRSRLFLARGDKRQDSLIKPIDASLLAAEVASLPKDSLLVEAGEFQVVQAQAGDIPLLLREIGRLREMTFRKVGEGTGKSCDLDGFDDHYQHVFLWNVEQREVAGAYRLGRSDELLREFGVKGLYISTLFELKPGFAHQLGPALELGRSFVRPEYQRSYNALLLLWRGIGTVVAREPRYRKLYGPVSITSEYTAASRQLIAGYFQSRPELPQLSRLVKPRTPLKVRTWLSRVSKALVTDVESLEELVSDIEAGRMGIPVLLRQYLKMGGKLLAFNVDRDFSDALDGLIVVDLLETGKRQLERYLGKEGAEGFLAHHDSGGFERSA